MTKKKREPVFCQICGKQKDLGEIIPAELVSKTLIETIRRSHSDWSSSGFICLSDLNQFRSKYVQDILEAEKGKLSASEEEVVKSLKEKEFLSKDINIEYERKLTIGERMADAIAEFGGSWIFIISFAVVFLIWIAINTIILLWKPFDPYPFILLNLVLSALAAIQAPIILMSQNREDAKDRLRSEYDYKVNLKAELEVHNLNEKIDNLLVNQWQRLLEIQEIQMELMQELASRISKG
jgi:uncharacterized membrane protein